MISLTPQMYTLIACRLFEELKTGGNFFNGRVEFDTPEFYSTLTCSAIVYRRQDTGPAHAAAAVEKLVPVWWEFTAWADGVAQQDDFSWNELTRYFSYA